MNDEPNIAKKSESLLITALCVFFGLGLLALLIDWLSRA